ncbi:hypothetical protein HMPREF1556_01306 [Porphyromonas sp. oral taxon 278 str. W7784]|nr:hypothetical protein HMPREF1556_01306 [Porphyromonas sp. oral taxon 278 str. W7784]
MLKKGEAQELPKARYSRRSTRASRGPQRTTYGRSSKKPTVGFTATHGRSHRRPTTVGRIDDLP